MMGMLATMMGKAKGKGKGWGEGWGGGDSWGSGGYGAEEDDWSSSKKFRKIEEGWTDDVVGLNEAIISALNGAGVTSAGADVEELAKKIQGTCVKQIKRFAMDERASQKMNGAECRAFLGECVESIMGSLATALYDKEWFHKVVWGPPLLTLILHAFADGKIFTRTAKIDIESCIDEGILCWSEEERVSRVAWNALEAGGVAENQRKKANQHLLKAYDEAHWKSPFGETESAEGPDVTKLQEFLKGWMTHFMKKAWGCLDNGLVDSSPAGQVECLRGIFQALLDPNCPVLPLSLQSHCPSAPWAYIEECATEVISEQTK